MENPNEMVNHPDHYQGQGGMECIDAMEGLFGKEAVEHFCILSAFKYISRYKGKNKPVEDLEKAKWYITKVQSLIDYK